jgi:hypothetical protein
MVTIYILAGNVQLVQHNVLHHTYTNIRGMILAVQEKRTKHFTDDNSCHGMVC